MKTHAEVVHSVRMVFGTGAEWRVAQALLAYLDEFPRTKHITFGFVHRLAPNRFSDSSVVRTLQYLAGEDIGLLQIKFEFLRDEDEPQDITDAEARGVLTASINPFTGHEDPEASKKLLIYFEPKASDR